MKNALIIACIVITIALGILGWFILPDVIAVQFNFKGEVSNTMPKLFAIIIPIVIAVIGGVIGLVSSGTYWKKGVSLMIVGLVVIVVTFVFNCKIM